MGRAISALTLAAILSFQAGSAEAESKSDSVARGTLIVRVDQVGSDSGRVCAWIFGGEKGFPSKKKHAAHRGCASIKDGKAALVFRDIPFGTYAAFAFHDEDEDGLVRKNWLGMPKEGVGASRGAGGIGGPSFDDARFDHKRHNRAISISLKYL